jgi:hypothetical protein
MRPLHTTIAVTLAIGGLAAVAAVRAQEQAKPPLRLEVARDVVKTLSAVDKEMIRVIVAVDTAGERAPEDLSERLGKLSDQIDGALLEARKLTKPVTLAELTESERKALEEELRKETREQENPLQGWQQRAIERSLEGAELSEEQELAARDIISTWFADSLKARADGDSKRSSDLKRQRNKDLTKALGRKRARKVINNLDQMGNRWR